MKLAAMALLLTASQLVSAQELQSAEQALRDSEIKLLLAQSRLDRLKRHTESAPIREDLKQELLRISEPDLFEAALREVGSSKGQKRIDADIAARTALVKFSNDYVSNDAIREFILSKGLDGKQLRQEALKTQNPAQLASIFSQPDVWNRLVRRIDDKSVVGPSKEFPDHSPPPWVTSTLGSKCIYSSNVFPDICKPPFEDALTTKIKVSKPKLDSLTNIEVWRPGVPYAAVLATKSPAGSEAFCSATLIGMNTAVTALHCLVNGSKARNLDSTLLFIPYGPPPHSKVSIRGKTVDARAVKISMWAWRADRLPVTASMRDDTAAGGDDIAILTLADSGLDASSLAASVRIGNSTTSDFYTMIGFGSTEKASDDGGVLIGHVNRPLHGVSEKSNVLSFRAAGPPAGGGSALCGGDSGGGIFAGIVDGSNPQPMLIGIISGLVGVWFDSNTDTQRCYTREQRISSLMSPRNRAYVCGKLPGMCVDAGAVAKK